MATFFASGSVQENLRAPRELSKSTAAIIWKEKKIEREGRPSCSMGNHGGQADDLAVDLVQLVGLERGVLVVAVHGSGEGESSC